MLVKTIGAMALLLCVAAGAQETPPVIESELLQQYQDRIAKVYLPMKLAPDKVVEYTRRYFGRDFIAVDRSDGGVDFFYVQRREGEIIFYHLLVSIDPPKPQ